MELHSYISGKQRKRRRRQRYFGLCLGVLVLYGILMFTAWLVLRSPVFRVEAVNIEGNSAVSSDAVMALVQSSALRGHGFFKSLLGFDNILTWPKSLSSSDLAFDPRLEGAVISKNYFSREINVRVDERTPAGVWCFAGHGEPSAQISPGVQDAENAQGGGGDCYYFDANGFIFSRALDTEGGQLYSIHDESQAPQGLGGSILASQFIPNMVSILNVLRESGIAVQSITLHDISLQEISVETGEGPTIYFSLRFPADEDLSVLENLISKPSFSKLSYVDFRVQNRAYYK